MKISISWLIALLAGLVILVGYFIPNLGLVQELLLQVAVILAAFATLAGVLNLLSVHWHKVETNQKGSTSSIFLILAFFIPLAAAGLDWLLSGQPIGYWTLWVFNNIQVPVEGSLFALLAIVLAYAIARLLRRRVGVTTLVFFVTAMIVLLLNSPYVLGAIPGLDKIRDVVTQVLATGGARGILLGVALGTIATGIRILMGADRPYG